MTVGPTDRSVLLWHVHGSWTDAFVSGRHRYLLPVNHARDVDGLGLAGRDWPRAHEVAADEMRHTAVDLVILQRPHEVELAQRLLGRRPGVDVPAVYVEHNAPRPSAADSVHPLAHQRDIPLVHVTDFNRLMWDNGIADTTVIGHGIPDPGHLYTGDIAAAATMINEPIRRNRIVGTDLLEQLAAAAPVDVWGIGTEALNHPDHRLPGVTGRGDSRHADLMSAVAARRVYLHTARWTSLGLSLIEAMFLGMPVVCVGSTMAPLVVPAEAGVVSADTVELADALKRYVTDVGAATLAGKAAREFAVTHFSLQRFLDGWQALIDALCEGQGAKS
ncbi:glycosyltransferase [Mycobacterium sp. NPDC003323]